MQADIKDWDATRVHRIVKGLSVDETDIMFMHVIGISSSEIAMLMCLSPEVVEASIREAVRHFARVPASAEEPKPHSYWFGASPYSAREA